jgi:lipopolysaccharide cholinephosphotransferase
MKNPELIEQYHQRLMKLLEFFDDMCRKNDIKYTVLDGTLLGAVREKGMIPWDADIDVALTPKELEKLKVAFESYDGRYYLNYLPNHYKGTKHNFVDIRAGRIVDKKCSSAVFGLDIFSIDFLGDDYDYAQETLKIYQKYWKRGFFATAFHKPALYVNNKLSWKGVVARVFYPCFYLISKVYTPFYVKSYLNFRKTRIDCNREDCKYFSVEPFFLRFGVNENTFLKDGYVDMPFGNLKVMAAKNYDIYLSGTYGDYMTPPPEDKRTPYPAEDLLTNCKFED